MPNQTPVVAKPIPDLKIASGTTFEFGLCPSGAVVFGYDVGGKKLRATDNYFANQVRFFKDWEDVAFSHNTIAIRDASLAVQLDQDPGQHPRDYQWNENTYLTSASRPFQIANSLKTLDQWRSSTGLDSGCTLSTRTPLNRVAVRPNLYEPGRGHVVIYNWERRDKVAVDLSQVLEIGTHFRIYHVLELHGQAVVTGVFTGEPVFVPMVDVISSAPHGHRPVAPLMVDREFGAFLVVSDVEPSPPQGQSFFVSPQGSPAGNGTVSAPWDLPTALAHPPEVHPGDTIWIQGGIYGGRLTSQLSGTASAPLHVRATPRQKVQLDLFMGDPKQAKRLTINGRFTHYQGLEIFSSDPTSRTTQQAGSWPTDVNRGDFNVHGDNIKLINLEIHDLNNGLGYWSTGDGGEVHGTLIYNNGWIGPDRNHGHAIYSQNAQSTRVFSDNIAFNQFRNGIKIYGSNQATLKNYHLQGNVVFNNGGGGGEGFVGAFQVLIGGGSRAENITLEENFTYVGKSYFQDLDVGDRLTYSAQLVGGKPLPKWLDFRSSDAHFSGLPSIEDVGRIEVEVKATDLCGDSISEVFAISVRSAEGAAAQASSAPRH